MSLPQAVAALVAAEVRGCSIMSSRQGADSQGAADGEQKGGTCADKPVLSTMIDEIEQGAVVVTVHISGSHASGSEDSSSSGESVSSASDV